MNQIRRLWPPLLLSLILGGCSVVQQPPELPPTLSWTQHQHRLIQLEHWQLQGKIGILNAGDGLSANLYWQQQARDYTINLSGPLGQSGTLIRGTPRGVELEIAGEGSYQAATPEALLQERLGWQLPISQINWWIRGLPAPDTPYRHSLEENRLATLDQNGWHVQYMRYQHFGILLPTKIRLQRGDLQITFIVKEWLLPNG